MSVKELACWPWTRSGRRCGYWPTVAPSSSGQRTQTADRLQRLLVELTPARGKKDITTPQAKAILASVRPRDQVGKTRRHLAAEQLADLVAVEKKVKALSKELKALVEDSGLTLVDLPGVGPIVAARLLVDVGEVTRFADRNRFASWTGTASIEASSSETVRHRLSRGHRRMNHMIHIAVATQVRLDTEGRAHYRRKLAAGRSAQRRCGVSSVGSPTPSTGSSLLTPDEE